MGSMTGTARRYKRAALRAATAPLGSLTSISVDDHIVRLLATRGNTVLHATSVDLPEGVVSGGAVADAERFSALVSGAIEQLREGSRARGRRFALSVSGRNMVQSRLIFFDTGDEPLEEAVLTRAMERMSVRSSDAQIAWHAEPVQPAQPEEGAGPAPSAGDPEGEHLEIYAMGLFRNVLELNLDPLREIGMKPVSAAPKPLALAAAVNEPRAVVMDVEGDTVSVTIVRDGLPEVARDLRLEPDMSPGQWSDTVAEHLEKCAGFHDSLYPDAPVTEGTPFFVTGSGATKWEAEIDDALAGTPFERSPMPAALSAPDDFDYAEYAACAGLAVMAGKKFWQRSVTAPIERPRLQFLPPEYRPKPLPVKPALATVAALSLAVGLGGAADVLAEQQAEIQQARRTSSELEAQADLRMARGRSANKAESGIERMQQETEALVQRWRSVVQAGSMFSTTLANLVELRPDGVRLSDISDDGSRISLSASGPSYEALLAYTRALQKIPTFSEVRLNSIKGGSSSSAETDGEGASASITINREGASQ